MSVVLTNNAVSRLASSLASGATSLSVTSGDGVKFPSPAGGDWFPLTLIKASGALEILRCTARSGDVLTVVRAQEGTAAQAFAAGDRAELRITAAAMNMIFGGPSAFPSFGSMELISAAPYIDFHHGSSATDFTSRITTDSTDTVSIYSASGGKQVSFADSGFTSFMTIFAPNGVVSQNGSVRVRNSSTLAFTDYSYDGKVSIYDNTPNLVTSGAILHTGNFNPATKITGDDCLIAGISGGTSPYMRRAADNSLFFLQRALGYTPVQQGTGVGQSGNAIKIGVNVPNNRLAVTIDNTDYGFITTDDKVLPIISQQGTGAVGTYAFCLCAVAATPGAMVSGSNLTLGYAAGQGATTLSGTWRCMGDTPANGRTLFLRAA